MAELGETAEPRDLVPGDPAAIDAVAASMTRLGAALLRVGDGLGRIDMSGWEGEAADAFRSAFAPAPAQWTGSGQAFADASESITDHVDVLAWAQGEAAGAIEDWERARRATLSAQADHERAVDAESAASAVENRPALAIPFVDPGDVDRAAAQARLARARAEVAASGDRAAATVGRARDLAPPAPTFLQRLGSATGDMAAGSWQYLKDTGQFLWQVDPARFIVEPAEAVAGWRDLGDGLADAATHPQEALEQGLNLREAATNPDRFAGEALTGLGLSALGGAGAAKHLRGVAGAGRIAAALGDGDQQAGPAGRYAGKTAAEHAADGGVSIGRPGSGKSNTLPVREVDTSAEVDDLYRALAAGGTVSHPKTAVELTTLPDGTVLTHRTTSKSVPDESTLDIRSPDSRQRVRIHTPK